MREKTISIVFASQNSGKTFHANEKSNKNKNFTRKEKLFLLHIYIPLVKKLIRQYIIIALMSISLIVTEHPFCKINWK